MSQVITFEGYTPVARYDDIPWTQARVEEATSPTGPWATIDTLPLSPVDMDPSNPATRNLTTELATDTPNLWYRIVFLDGSADESAPTAAVQNTSFSGESITDGPCEPWINGDALAAACGAATGSTDLETYAGAAEGAYNILFALSGRIYTGICADTVRPCVGHCHSTSLCGCSALSRVKLAGFPVREIISVKIDGELISEDRYRLDGRKWLTRLADADGARAYWPSCQRLDLDDTEVDTFSVRYFHGQDPPAEGIAAAYELGCELFRAGQGDAACKLPQGTVSVSKQGLSIDIGSLSMFLQKGQTGLPLVDIFLKTANPAGKTRRSAFYSPGNVPYARRLG